jgi:YegS/Rv2252/BmrU family lipid kinase
MVSAAVSLFLNPTAGRGRAGRRLPAIIRAFEAEGLSYDLITTRGVGDLEAQVITSLDNEPRTIVIAGGDGSVHEAVNGILRARCSARLGVIPTGTGNDFAKACGISLDWQASAKNLARQIRRGTAGAPVDAGRVNGRFFANGIGIGFDAKVTQVARSYRWPIGDLVYLLAIFRCMADGIATPEMTVSSGEFSWRGRLTLVDLSNGPWIGGMFHIAPTARNDDGQLNLIALEPVSRLRVLGLLPKLLRGRHLVAPEVHHVATRRVIIEASQPLSSHLDGEVQPLADRFEIDIVPAALELIRTD